MFGENDGSRVSFWTATLNARSAASALASVALSTRLVTASAFVLLTGAGAVAESTRVGPSNASHEGSEAMEYVTGALPSVAEGSAGSIADVIVCNSTTVWFGAATAPQEGVASASTVT